MRFLTAGESHGKALVGILEGIPSGLALSVEDLKNDLVRRKMGYGRGDRQKIESDSVEILSGVRHGKTLGSPISLLIENKDFKNWEKTMSVRAEDKTSDREVVIPRPGHADFVGAVKYDFDDMRNVLERASARETTMRVALGGVAKKFLREFGVHVLSRVTQIGEVRDTTPWGEYSSDLQNQIDASEVRSSSVEATQSMISEIERAKEEGDTLGGIFEVCAFYLPKGLGSYVHWDRRIEGKLAQALMSLNAIKGVEVGEGFASAQKRGSQVHDEIVLSQEKEIGFDSNRSGGITGGMTTGQNLIVRAAMKPLSTLKKSLKSVSVQDLQEKPAHFERSDVCAVPSAGVIGESLVALVLAQEFLQKFGGDSMTEIASRYQDWKKFEGEKFGKEKSRK